MKLFLSPHNDDETLFGAYLILRYKPKVIVCFRSFVEEAWPNGPRYPEREAETDAAMQVLGSDWEQWEFRDDEPFVTDYKELCERLVALAPNVDQVFAPMPEKGGHYHHNLVGNIAAALFPYVTFYTTYTHDRGRTLGTPVPVEDGWEDIKRKALTRYGSQIALPQTRMHFERPMDEYVA